MEIILLYFIINKIKIRTKEYEYNSAPHIKLAVILWLMGESVGFLAGMKLFSSWLVIYLMAVACGSLGGFFVFYKVMRLPKRNLDYFDLRQSKVYPYLGEESADTTKQKESEDNDVPFWVAQPQPQSKPQTQSQPQSQPQPQSQSQPSILEPQKAVFNEVPNAVRKDLRNESTPAAFSEVQKTGLGVFGEPQPPVKESVPEQSMTFMNRTEKTEEPIAATKTNLFKFPYSELLPLDDLYVSDYGVQTVKDQPVSEFAWFGQFKSRYENREIRLALTVLENALLHNADNGFIWLLYGGLYKDVYQNYEKALQFCLTGAKRSNSYKSALLTEAAEILLLALNNIPLAFKFFCHAVTAITETSKAWGQPGSPGAISQERAFHYIRIFLTVYNFNDYRLYLERNVKFHTGLDQALIERVIALCNESPSRNEVEALIRHLFPLIIEKLQSLG